MIEEMQTDSELVVYAKKHSIRELSGEDILKLITKSYLMKDIIEVFKITEREWKDIRKQKGIENVTIKNIDPYDFSTMKLTPVLYRVEQSER